MPNHRSNPSDLKGPALARVLGVTTRHLFNLRAQGMPHTANGNDVFYPMPAAVEWYFRRKLEAERPEPATPETQPGDPEHITLLEAERRKAVADAERSQIQVDQLRGRLVDVESFDREMTYVLQRLRGIVLRHPKLREVADEILLELRDQEAPGANPADDEVDLVEPEPAVA